jgi:hypothetical protein
MDTRYDIHTPVHTHIYTTHTHTFPFLFPPPYLHSISLLACLLRS